MANHANQNPGNPPVNPLPAANPAANPPPPVANTPAVNPGQTNTGAPALTPRKPIGKKWINASIVVAVIFFAVLGLLYFKNFNTMVVDKEEKREGKTAGKEKEMEYKDMPSDAGPKTVSDLEKECSTAFKEAF